MSELELIANEIINEAPSFDTEIPLEDQEVNELIDMEV